MTKREGDYLSFDFLVTLFFVILGIKIYRRITSTFDGLMILKEASG